ncbi:hypothetical protein L7F22_035618 [Adiantum nelumboides]|nr:hypothetical protein [Adiantum nelumboides]
MDPSPSSTPIISDCLHEASFPDVAAADALYRQVLQAFSDDDFDSLLLVVETIDEISLDEALSGPEASSWRQAMDSKYQSLMANGTWQLVPAPPNRNLVTCKWLLHKKFHADGSVSRYKARLVACGFTQIPSMDYSETFSHVLCITSFRVLIAIAALFGFLLHQMDVRTAFLNGDLQEEIYMSQPDGGYTSLQHLDYVCRLLKALYGLKQSPRQWYLCFHQCMISLSYTRFQSDANVYSRHSTNVLLFLAIYVDDILILSNSQYAIDKAKGELQASFSMIDMSTLHYCLGIQIFKEENSRKSPEKSSQRVIETESDTENDTEESDHSRWRMDTGRTSRRKEKSIGHRSRTLDGHYKRDRGPDLKIVCPIFKGKKHDDLDVHIQAFEQYVELKHIMEEEWGEYFPPTLKEAARKWYYHDPDVHIQAFEQYAKLKHIMEEEWGEYFPFTLKEAARKWYYHYLASKLQVYRKLKKDFILEYTDDRGDDNILCELDKIKQGKLSVRKYVQKIKEVTRRLNEPPSKKRMRAWFLSGFNSRKLREQDVPAPTKKFTELVHRALKLEQQAKKEKSKHRGRSDTSEGENLERSGLYHHPQAPLTRQTLDNKKGAPPSQYGELGRNTQ